MKIQNISARLLEIGKPFQFVESSIPTPGLEQVIIKMEFAGVCRTDVNLQRGELPVQISLPITPGHEGVGHVVAVGQGVHDLRVGDRVCTGWIHQACGNCEHCCTGWENTCEAQSNNGFNVNGSFTQFMLAAAGFCAKVPEGLPSEQAVPISCAGVSSYRALKESGVKSGQWIVIVGAAGGLGHIGLQYAKFMGMKVIAVVTGANRVEFVTSLGCDFALDANDENVIEKIVQITGGGAHGALILAPDQKCITESIGYLRRRGTAVLLSLPPGDFCANTFAVVLKGLTIKGSVVGNRQDLQEALNIACEGKIKCVVDVRPFRDIQKVFTEFADGSHNGRGRVILDISQI